MVVAEHWNNYTRIPKSGQLGYQGDKNMFKMIKSNPINILSPLLYTTACSNNKKTDNI